MTRTIYSTGSSLDGFLATDDHALDWLITREIDADNGPGGYRAFERTVGAIAMGSATYRWIRDNDPSAAWPYDVPTWVLTHRSLPPFPASASGATPDIRYVAADDERALRALHAEMAAAAGERDLWLVGGGDLVGQFADLGLLDEVQVAFAPVTLGSGAPLLPRRVELRLEETDRNGDFVWARYSVPAG